MERKKYGTTTQVRKRFGISRSCLWNWQQQYDFPKPVHFSATKRDRARYDWDRIDAWEDRARAKSFPFAHDPSDEGLDEDN